MNEEQKARLAEIARRETTIGGSKGEDWIEHWRRASTDARWLLALVNELDEENAWLQGEADREFHRGQRTAVENPDGPIAIMLESLTAELDRANRAALANGELSLENHSRAMRAEQQLAAVTAALKAAGVDHVGSLTEQVIRLAADRDGHHANLQRIRDELNHDVWRLEEERDKLRVEAQRISAEYAQYRNTAEVERDELKREVERLTMLTQKVGAIVTRVRDHSLSFGLHDVGASNLSTALLVASVLAQCGEAVSPELEQAAKKWEADREDAITRAEKAEAERDALRSTLDLIANGAGEHSKASPTECRDLARATLAKLSGAR